MCPVQKWSELSKTFEKKYKEEEPEPQLEHGVLQDV
jgi:hypothetical protein